MKSLFAVLFFVATSSVSPAQEYEQQFSSDGEIFASCVLSIGNDAATATTDGLTEHFDLKNQRWQDVESGDWVSMTQYPEWAESIRQELPKKIESMPEEMRSLATWSLNPTFKIEETESTLKLVSGYVDYTIEMKRSDVDLTNYYLCCRLSCCGQAMADGKPAFAHLKVLDLLEQRKVIPASMTVHLVASPRAPKMTVTTQKK